MTDANLNTAADAAADRNGDRPADGDGPDGASYRVALENFAGPLDLLLHLIKKEELEKE